MPTLANLRSRKTANVNFKPSTAYWIAGHGEEPNYNNTFKVPPGCVIPSGNYRVLWILELYLLPALANMPLNSTLWIKGNTKS